MNNLFSLFASTHYPSIIDDTGSGVDRWTTNPFLSTTPKVGKTTQGVRSVDYQTVSGDRTSDLMEKLRGIIATQGLACADKGKFIHERSLGRYSCLTYSSSLQYDSALRCKRQRQRHTDSRYVPRPHGQCTAVGGGDPGEILCWYSGYSHYF